MCGDGYEACRLLLLDRITALEVKGDHVAMVPNRDTLLVTGTDDVLGLQIMAELGRKAMQEPRAISAIPLRLVDAEWQDWMPPADHPAFGSFNELRLTFLAEEYEEQKQLLDSLHEKQGVDEFVASYELMKHRDTGDLRSMAVWTEGVVSLLPEADMVFFHRPDTEETVEAMWADVVRVVPDLLEATEYYPPRWRVSGFPTEEQLAAMTRP
jgi:hypothetical protein